MLDFLFLAKAIPVDLAPYIWAIYLCLVAIPLLLALTWFLCFLSWSGILPWPKIRDTHHFLAITGIVVTISCVFIWVGAIIEFFPIKAATTNLLWVGIVSGLLVTFGSWIRKILMGNPKPKQRVRKPRAANTSESSEASSPPSLSADDIKKQN